MFSVFKRTAAGVLCLLLPSVLLASEGSSAGASATSTSPVYLILSAPEGTANSSKEPVETLGSHAGAVFGTPWVKSVKRDAPSGFARLSTVAFADATSLEAWSKAHAVQTKGLVAKRARALLSSKSGATGSPRSVFKISYYSLVAPVTEFTQWVDGYLAKYLDAQQKAGILSSYVMYLEQGNRGRALLVLEYPDASTEQSAEPIKEKLSEKLAASDAVYAKQMVKKEELRTTDSWTLAVPLAAAGK